MDIKELIKREEERRAKLSPEERAREDADREEKIQQANNALMRQISSIGVGKDFFEGLKWQNSIVNDLERTARQSRILEAQRAAEAITKMHTNAVSRIMKPIGIEFLEKQNKIADLVSNLSRMQNVYDSFVSPKHVIEQVVKASAISNQITAMRTAAILSPDAYMRGVLRGFNPMHSTITERTVTVAPNAATSNSDVLVRIESKVTRHAEQSNEGFLLLQGMIQQVVAAEERRGKAERGELRYKAWCIALAVLSVLLGALSVGLALVVML